MRRFIFSTNIATQIVTVGLTAYFFIFTGSVEAHEVQESEVVVVCPVSSAPDVVIDKSLETSLRFQRLAAKWREERGATSSITEMSICPAYQSIIGMGDKAVPLILAELASEADDPDQWFWALQAITGANPVREGDQGNFPIMAQSWLEWARNEGHAW